MKKLLTLLIFSFIIGCASTENIISDYDETVDFNKYTTFVICIDDLFVENTTFPKYDNNKIRSYLSDAVGLQMVSLGHKTNVLNPELQAGFKLVVEEKESTFKNCDIKDELGYWKECSINTEIYTTESLIIYVSDFEMNQIIWQASIECNMNKSSTNLKSYINDLVIKLFNEYPISKN